MPSPILKALAFMTLAVATNAHPQLQPRATYDWVAASSTDSMHAFPQTYGNPKSF